MARPDSDSPRARSQADDTAQMRMVAVVIAVTMVAWLGFQWLGGHYGLPAKYAFLADLLAIGAMIWSLVVTWRIWRRRNAPSR